MVASDLRLLNVSLEGLFAASYRRLLAVRKGELAGCVRQNPHWVNIPLWITIPIIILQIDCVLQYACGQKGYKYQLSSNHLHTKLSAPVVPAPATYVSSSPALLSVTSAFIRASSRPRVTPSIS